MEALFGMTTVIIYSVATIMSLIGYLYARDRSFGVLMLGLCLLSFITTSFGVSKFYEVDIDHLLYPLRILIGFVIIFGISKCILSLIKNDGTYTK